MKTRTRMVERLVLFDVDGTLVRGGPAKEAFRVALVETFGTAGAIEGHEFSGKTDPQIARELLTGAGLGDSEVDRGFPALWRRYLSEMARLLPHRPLHLLPGVTELLDALESRGDVALGLLTGNIAPGARLKLGSVGLADRFPVGGFGSDDEVRDRLPPVAVRRAREHWGVSFAPEAVVVIGDTPRDVACGRSGGHRTVAVATGRIPRR
ncbi:MAG: HAD family hydrolase, partial [Longimicrobiales bacterium]